MKESPSRLEVYVVMSLLAILLLFAQNAYYLASERLTIRIEAAVGAISHQQQQQQVIMPRQPHELDHDLNREALKRIQEARLQGQNQ